MRKLAAGLLAVLAAACSAAAARADENDVAMRVRAAIDEAVAQGFSGAVLVSVDETILVEGIFGSMNGRPLPPDGRFLLASAAKQFTSAAILRLQDRGDLALDDPISRFLPGVPADKQAITIRQLLSHTSGIAQGYASETAANGEEAATRILAEPLEANPGERFVYSNENYALASAIVETAGKARYADFVQAELLAPLQLRETGQVDGPGAIDRLSPLLEPLPPRLANLRWGGHGYYTTARDFFAWYRALRAGSVLKPASVAALFEPQARIGEGQSGLGWFLGTSASGEPTVFTRGNEDIGANSLLYAYPRREAVVVVLTHAGNANDDQSWSRAMLARIEALLPDMAPR